MYILSFYGCRPFYNISKKKNTIDIWQYQVAGTFKEYGMASIQKRIEVKANIRRGSRGAGTAHFGYGRAGQLRIALAEEKRHIGYSCLKGITCKT